MSKLVELKSCPFCGSNVIERFSYAIEEHKFWQCGVLCRECNARQQGVARFEDTVMYVVGHCVRRWNRRAGHDAAKGRQNRLPHMACAAVPDE